MVERERKGRGRYNCGKNMDANGEVDKTSMMRWQVVCECRRKQSKGKIKIGRNQKKKNY